ncbi:putative LRR receptor-like serine/threonine-protein kinase [Gossypium australe]|uniref:Putative LRR receptor-like serine/threonine-protein kinase n=1 Tax=Gossypium australe TaxID=47621 RepID=A0A5B6VMU5_9ROSI|nr:putative LRR receptor-like serine/threonine-protein kinase [Gossypium australe]
MSSSSFSPTPQLVLNAFDPREGIVNADPEPPPLKAKPTVAQIKQHFDDRAKMYKAMSCLQNSVSDLIFTRIMACETPK